MQRQFNQRRKPWCNQKMCRKSRSGAEELRFDNAICATLCVRVCSKDVLMCRYRVRREANEGRLKMLLKKFSKCFLLPQIDSMRPAQAQLPPL